jgi:hypothetical protein
VCFRIFEDEILFEGRGVRIWELESAHIYEEVKTVKLNE